MDLRPIDLADEVALRAAYDVESAATRDVRAGWVALDPAARLFGWRAHDGWSRIMVGAYDGNRLLGVGVSMTSDDEPATTWIDVSVDPVEQRRGVGRAVASAAEAASPAGARRFVASAYRVDVDAMTAFVDGFAIPLGYTTATTETVVELDLRDATFDAVDDPAGYTVATYINGVPAEQREQVGAIKGLVDAEAPNGELNWTPSPVTVEEYDEEIAHWCQQGRTILEATAVATDGTVAAWTCLIVEANPARPASTEGTLVLRDHRGHRLGLAVKTACLRVARDETNARRVKTSSDDENRWMRAINAQLGFVPVETEVVLHKLS